MASAVTRPQSNKASLEYGGTGDSYHGRAADSEGVINKDPNA